MKSRLVRTLLAASALLAIVLTGSQGASATQSGPDVNAIGQIQWCRAGGGVATVSEERTYSGGLETVVVACAGGLWDGIFCFNDQGGSFCYFTRIASDDVTRATVTAGRPSETDSAGAIHGGEPAGAENSITPLETEE